MKKLLVALSIIFGTSNLYAGYTENLYLCDMGIKNVNFSNALGVDFIQYSQNGRTLNLSASSNYTTALDQALRLNPSFDRWNPLTGINDVSIDLGSDYFGAQYYLEYCYTWDRTLPTDNINYDVTFTSSLPNAVPFTQMGVDTNCSLMANNGAVINTQVAQSFTATNYLSTDFTSMRCTIRLTFTEDSFFIKRPHNGNALGIDPNVTTRVSP